MSDDLVERLARRRYNADRNSLFDPEWCDVTGYVRDALIQDVSDTIAAARAEGLTLVPVEATGEMVRAAIDRSPTEACLYNGIWRAMVAAGRADGGEG